MHNLIVRTALVFSLLSSYWPHAQADQKLAFAACALVGSPFLASEMYRGTSGGGCSWGLTNPDGVTQQNEVLQAHATRALPKDQLALGVEIRLHAFREAAAQGGGTLAPLRICDGGWFISSDLRPTKPVRNGFYTCGLDLIEIEAQGPESIKQFMHVARGMYGVIR